MKCNSDPFLAISMIIFGNKRKIFRIPTWSPTIVWIVSEYASLFCWDRKRCCHWGVVVPARTARLGVYLSSSSIHHKGNTPYYKNASSCHSTPLFSIRQSIVSPSVPQYTYIMHVVDSNFYPNAPQHFIQELLSKMTISFSGEIFLQ